MRRSAAALIFVSLALGCPAAEMMAPPPTVDELLYDCNHLPPGQTTVASDESFRAISDAEDATGLVTDDQRAPRLSAPAAGGALSASTPPRFEFQAKLAENAPPGPASPRPRSTFATLLRAAAPAVAWAHCPAVTGDNFIFRVEASGHPVYTALLSVTAFTPDTSKWQAALAPHVGSTVTLTLARAYLLQGRVIEGPYVGATRATFTVQP
jgi:hypothetical protein